jgi:hypothetical protein
MLDDMNASSINAKPVLFIAVGDQVVVRVRAA